MGLRQNDIIKVARLFEIQLESIQRNLNICDSPGEKKISWSKNFEIEIFISHIFYLFKIV